VPLNGLDYVHTRQPVDVGLWPMSFSAHARYFTTVGNYRQEGGDVEWGGSLYRWSKHHEWERFIELPARCGQEFEIAIQRSEPEDRRRLTDAGWRLTPALAVSLDAFGSYRRYIAGSRAEFTVAKDQNVRLRSGWFSERAVCYLASGKPVVTQDTGFSSVLPTGAGLFAVRNVEEAAAAVSEINADYARHCHAAREIALEYFEASGVAARLLRSTGLA
jgi:hypothetical protein